MREGFIQPREKKGKSGNLPFSSLREDYREDSDSSQDYRAKIQSSTGKKYSKGNFIHKLGKKNHSEGDQTMEQVTHRIIEPRNTGQPES